MEPIRTPIVRGQFAYDGDELLVEGHPRATLKRIQRQLTHGRGERRSPEDSATFWRAQLIHYGLPVRTTEKGKLQAGFRNALPSLEGPPAYIVAMEKEMEEQYYAQKPVVESVGQISDEKASQVNRPKSAASTREECKNSPTEQALEMDWTLPFIYEASTSCRSAQDPARHTAVSPPSESQNISDHSQSVAIIGPYSCLCSSPLDVANSVPPSAFDLTLCQEPSTMRKYCVFRLRDGLGAFWLPEVTYDLSFPIVWQAKDLKCGEVGHGDGLLTIYADGRFDGNLVSEERVLHIKGVRSEERKVFETVEMIRMAFGTF